MKNFNILLLIRRARVLSFILVFLLPVTIFCNTSASPVVVTPVEDRNIYKDEVFNILIPYETFNDADKDALTLTVKKADGQDLPEWLSAYNSPPLEKVGEYNTQGYSVATKVIGNIIFNADKTQGITIIDFSDPFAPSLINKYNTNIFDDVLDIDVKDNYVFLANGASGFRILDITDMRNPKFARLIGSLGTVKKFVIKDNYAYLASTGGLHIIDITDPKTAQKTGNLDTSLNELTVAVKGDYAFIGGGLDGVKSVNITNCTDPKELDTYDTGSPEDMFVVENILYVADWESGLVILDITDPTNLNFLGSCSTQQNAYGVVVDDDDVYIADYMSGVSHINATDLTTPVLTGNNYDTTSAFNIQFANNYLVVADYSGGVLILEGAKGGIRLIGTPTENDLGTLKLKAIANDGSNDVETHFNINVLTDIPVIKNELGFHNITDCNANFVVDDTIKIYYTGEGSQLDGGLVKLQGGVNLKSGSLIFADQNGIKGIYDGSTGELTLSGVASIKDYENALTTVKYDHPGNFVPKDPIVVSFLVHQGEDYSNLIFKNITVADNIASCKSGNGSESINPNILKSIIIVGSVVLVAMIPVGIVMWSGAGVVSVIAYKKYRKMRMKESNIPLKDLATTTQY